MPPLLDAIAEAGQRYLKAVEDVEEARADLRDAAEAALAEGVPLTVVARTAGLPRGLVRSILREGR